VRKVNLLSLLELGHLFSLVLETGTPGSQAFAQLLLFGPSGWD
jgi:hypothetical protein